jgi:histidinol-phosphate/aromatic aminotransferase/cobyric acid decarboxylase-like protein
MPTTSWSIDAIAAGHGLTTSTTCAARWPAGIFDILALRAACWPFVMYFVMYAMSAQLQGLKFIGVPLTPDFELDEAAMLAAIKEHQPSIIYLAYPNNPTANLWDDAVIEKIVEGGRKGLVVMDEAYQPFSSKSYIDRIAKHGTCC